MQEIVRKVYKNWDGNFDFPPELLTSDWAREKHKKGFYIFTRVQKCIKCGQVKKLSEFHRDGYNTGYRKTCKVCAKKYKEEKIGKRFKPIEIDKAGEAERHSQIFNEVAIKYQERLKLKKQLTRLKNEI